MAAIPENLNSKMQRVVIYPKDVQRITGKSEKYSRRLLVQIKARFSKEPHQFVSVVEFCQFTGLAPELVNKFMND
jgi:hypothetical protein